MDILDDMGVSKLSAKVFFFKLITPLLNIMTASAMTLCHVMSDLFFINECCVM